MFPVYSFQGDTLVPSTQAAAQCATQTLPFEHNEIVETYPAPLGSQFTRTPPTFAGPHPLGRVPRANNIGNIQAMVANNPAPLCADLSGIGAAGVPGARLYPGTLGGRSLGVGPAMAVPLILGSGVIGALLGIVAEALEDDWTSAAVFKANTTTIHNGMKVIQCMVGGAEPRKPFGCNAAGSCICPGGTQPICPLTETQKIEWRNLRDEWSAFYGSSGSEGTAVFGGATEGEALAAKQFAERMLNYYQKLETQICPAGVDLPVITSQPIQRGAEDTTDPEDDGAPPWLMWAVGGVAAVGFLVVAVTIKDLVTR